MLAGIAALAVSASASAFTFGSVATSATGNPAIYTSLPTVGITTADIGQSFDFTWNLPGSQQGGAGTTLSATGHFTVVSLNGTDLKLTATLTNTTAGSFQAALMSLGIGATPDVTASYTTAGAEFGGIGAGQGGNESFPGGFKEIDACVFTANNCSGGTINDGLQSGNKSDSFTLDLKGAFGATPSVTLSTFAVKFQTQAGSFEFPGGTTTGCTSNCGGGPGGGGVPEPSTLLVLAAALLGLSYMRWRSAAVVQPVKATA